MSIVVIAIVSGGAMAAIVWPWNGVGRSLRTATSFAASSAASSARSTVGTSPTSSRTRLRRDQSRATTVGALGAVGLVGLTAGFVLSSPTVALMPVPLVWFALLVNRRSRRRAERASRTAALSAFVDAVGIELRSGASLHGAIANATTGPQVEALAEEFGALQSSIDAGSTLDVALASLGDNSSNSELSLLAATAAVLAEHGGPVAPAIDRVSELIRSGQANDRAIRAQASQATASAAVMAGLPVAFGSVLALIDSRLAAFYLRSPLGTACVAACFVLVAIGWFWMDELIWAQR